MGPQEAIKSCFQDYFKFSGRARRPEFWWFTLFTTLGWLFLDQIDALVWGEEMLVGFGGLFTLLTFVPHLAVIWRRLHDVGRPGWLAVILFLAQMLLFFMISLTLASTAGGGGPPVVFSLTMLGLAGVMVFVFVLFAMPSQPGDNRYGPEPPAGS
ncbi:MAG: DUF805 domain-containing protein [Pseudomonadota bacterium]